MLSKQETKSLTHLVHAIKEIDCRRVIDILKIASVPNQRVDPILPFLYYKKVLLNNTLKIYRTCKLLLEIFQTFAEIDVDFFVAAYGFFAARVCTHQSK